MIEARFTNEMKDILKKLIGTEFICYSSSAMYEGETVNDGIVYIHASNLSIKISNAEKQIAWFQNNNVGTVEDIFSFHCEEAFEKTNQEVVFVREKIEKIELITDFLKIPEKNYEIALDMALIIVTEAHRYVISRGWHFGEYLDINVDKNYDDIYPVKQVVEEWNNFGEWEVIIERKTVGL